MRWLHLSKNLLGKVAATFMTYTRCKDAARRNFYGRLPLTHLKRTAAYRTPRAQDTTCMHNRRKGAGPPSKTAVSTYTASSARTERSLLHQA